MTARTLLLFLAISSCSSGAVLRTKDLSTTSTKADDIPCPRNGPTYILQPVYYSERFISTAVIDPFFDCHQITVSRVRTNIVLLTTQMTTVSPNGRTILPTRLNSCLDPKQDQTADKNLAMPSHCSNGSSRSSTTGRPLATSHHDTLLK